MDPARGFKYSDYHSHPANLSTICRMPLTISPYSRNTPDTKIVKDPAIVVNLLVSVVFAVGLRKCAGGHFAGWALWCSGARTSSLGGAGSPAA